MASTPLYRVNSPGIGLEYIAPSGYWVIPNNATSLTVEIKSYNSSNALIAISNLTAIVRNITGSTDDGSYNGGTANTTDFTDSSGNVNGTNVFAPAGSVGSACDHLTLQITSYTGKAYSQVFIRRSGAWVNTANIKLRRSGVWVQPAVHVRRSGAWVQLA